MRFVGDDVYIIIGCIWTLVRMPFVVSKLYSLGSSETSRGGERHGLGWEICPLNVGPFWFIRVQPRQNIDFKLHYSRIENVADRPSDENIILERIEFETTGRK